MLKIWVFNCLILSPKRKCLSSESPKAMKAADSHMLTLKDLRQQELLRRPKIKLNIFSWEFSLKIHIRCVEVIQRNVHTVQGNTCLDLITSVHHRHGVVPLVVLVHAVLADAAGVGGAEQVQGPLVALAGPPLDVPERVHQPVVLKFRIFQVRPEMGLAVRHQAGEAGLEGPAGAFNARVTYHIVGAQRFLLILVLFWSFFCLWFCFLFVLFRLLRVLGLIQVFLDLGLLRCRWLLTLFLTVFIYMSVSCSILFGTARLDGTLWTSFTFVSKTGTAYGVTTSCRLPLAQFTWADMTQVLLLFGERSYFHSCCICHVFSSSFSAWCHFHSLKLCGNNWLSHFCQPAVSDRSRESHTWMMWETVRTHSFSQNSTRPFSTHMQTDTHPPPRL